MVFNEDCVLAQVNHDPVPVFPHQGTKTQRQQMGRPLVPSCLGGAIRSRRRFVKRCGTNRGGNPGGNPVTGSALERPCDDAWLSSLRDDSSGNVARLVLNRWLNNTWPLGAVPVLRDCELDDVFPLSRMTEKQRLITAALRSRLPGFQGPAQSENLGTVAMPRCGTLRRRRCGIPRSGNLRHLRDQRVWGETAHR